MIWNLRSRYGEVYVTSFPDGTDVPWKPLSYGDFIYYTELVSEGRVPIVLLHEEIFTKSVVNPVFTESVDELDAGIVSMVAEDILNTSGPLQPDLFNQDMENARARCGLYIHRMSTIICQAFPSYTPEAIESMSYETVLLRLAQAEEILLRAKIITEPISLTDDKTEKPKRSNVSAEVLSAWERTGKKPVDIKPEDDKARKRKEAWERANRISMPEGLDTSPAKPPDPDSPLLKKHGKIDFKKENMELAMEGLSGWDRQDMAINQIKMIENAKKIYPHLFKKAAEALDKEGK